MTTSEEKILECYRVLNKAGSNVVWDILRQCDEFLEFDHYPSEDVYDAESHSQYYYHAHPQDDGSRWHEHGHFHLFMREAGMPKDCKPLVMPENYLSKDSDTLSHLIAISMDQQGRPIRLFTVNRWVVEDTWYKAEDVCKMLDNFSIDHAYPSWPTNIWLTEMVKLFKDEVKALIYARDAAIDKFQQDNPDQNPYEARELEITSVLDISVPELDQVN